MYFGVIMEMTLVRATPNGGTVTVRKPYIFYYVGSLRPSHRILSVMSSILLEACKDSLDSTILNDLSLQIALHPFSLPAKPHDSQCFNKMDYSIIKFLVTGSSS